jgi:hypothetical protein
MYRPEVQVTLIGLKARETIQALVDTGSDETVFPMSLADAIGVKLNRSLIGQASAVGGHAVQLVPGEVTIEITQDEVTHRWTTAVTFLDVGSPEDEVALLGYAGFLEYFRATFDSEHQELELTPNPRLSRLT